MTNGLRRSPSLVVPIVLIVLGILFLYGQWHPAFDPWPILRIYWPLILVFVGLGKIWDYSRRQRNPDAPRGASIGSTLGVIAFVLVLILLFWHGRAFSHGRFFRNDEIQHDVRSVDLQGAKSVNADLSLSAGRLDLRAGSSHLLDANLDYAAPYDAPEFDYSVSDDTGHLRIDQAHETPNFGTNNIVWRLQFNRNVPLDLKITVGAGESDIDLRDLDVRSLYVDMGAGKANVDLTGGRKADLTAEIHGGVGEADVRVPRNIGVIANASGGIGSVDAHGLHRDGDEFTNEAYGKAAQTIHLTIEGGVGLIRLIEE